MVFGELTRLMFKKSRVRVVILNIFTDAGFVRSDRPFPSNMNLVCHYVYEKGVDRWFRILSKQPASIEAYAFAIIEFTIKGCSPEKYVTAMEEEGKYKTSDIVDEDLLKEVKKYNDIDTPLDWDVGEDEHPREVEGDLDAVYGALLVSMNRYR